MAYASLTDLENVGFSANALGTLSMAQISACLQEASDHADGFFRNRWGYGSVPLVAWDTAVTGNVARIAAFLLMNVRGYRANSNADKQFEAGYTRAIEWLGLVEHQQVTPLVTLANANAPGSTQPNLVSKSVVDLSTGASLPNRGW